MEIVKHIPQKYIFKCDSVTCLRNIVSTNLGIRNKDVDKLKSFCFDYDINKFDFVDNDNFILTRLELDDSYISFELNSLDYKLIDNLDKLDVSNIYNVKIDKNTIYYDYIYEYGDTFFASIMNILNSYVTYNPRITDYFDILNTLTPDEVTKYIWFISTYYYGINYNDYKLVCGKNKVEIDVLNYLKYDAFYDSLNDFIYFNTQNFLPSLTDGSRVYNAFNQLNLGDCSEL